jgi:hypothetical protein
MVSNRREALVRLGVAGALVLGVVACGDDDESTDTTESTVEDTAEETTSTTEVEADEQDEVAGDDIDTYCSALVDFNSAVFEVEIDETTPAEDVVAAGEQLKPIFDEVRINAPEETAADAEDLGTAIDALLDGDQTAFNADATFEQYIGLVDASVDACGFPTTDVTAVDYAFEGVPETLPSGPQAIAFSNTSEGGEEHEFAVFRQADGETRSAEEVLNDPATEEEGPGQFVGAAFAPPGEEFSTLLELDPGNYIAVCFVPVGGAEEAPPHFTQGMFTEFSVS